MHRLIRKLVLIFAVWLACSGFGMSSTSVAFGSVGATYAEIVDVTQRARIVVIQNTLNANVTLSFDGGTTDHLILQSGTSVTLDLAASGMTHTGSVQQKYTSGAPTSGALIFTYVFQ